MQLGLAIDLDSIVLSKACLLAAQDNSKSRPDHPRRSGAARRASSIIRTRRSTARASTTPRACSASGTGWPASSSPSPVTRAGRCCHCYVSSPEGSVYLVVRYGEASSTSAFPSIAAGAIYTYTNLGASASNDIVSTSRGTKEDRTTAAAQARLP